MPEKKYKATIIIIIIIIIIIVIINEFWKEATGFDMLWLFQIFIQKCLNLHMHVTL